MDKTEASARLRALATGDKLRTDTARLREVFEDVEAALSAGVSRVNVLAELQNLGYTMTLSSFKSALQRIRKERNKGANSPATLDLVGVETLGKNEKDKDKPKAVPSAELVRPAGITNASWNEIQAKNAKLNRK